MVRKTLTYEVPGVRTVVTHNIRPKTDTALDQRKSKFRGQNRFSFKS